MSADVDLAEAIQTRWAASANLTTSVPGGLQCDMLTGDQDASLAMGSLEQPYAKLEITQPKAPEYSSRGDRVEDYAVTISVWGKGRSALGDVASLVGGVIEVMPWTVANTEAVMAIYAQGGVGIVRDEQTTKAGERLLKATIPYLFRLHRRDT